MMLCRLDCNTLLGVGAPLAICHSTTLVTLLVGCARTRTVPPNGEDDDDKQKPMLQQGFMGRLAAVAGQGCHDASFHIWQQQRRHLET